MTIHNYLLEYFVDEIINDSFGTYNSRIIQDITYEEFAPTVYICFHVKNIITNKNEVLRYTFHDKIDILDKKYISIETILFELFEHNTIQTKSTNENVFAYGPIINKDYTILYYNINNKIYPELNFSGPSSKIPECCIVFNTEYEFI